MPDEPIDTTADVLAEHVDTTTQTPTPEPTPTPAAPTQSNDALAKALADLTAKVSTPAPAAPRQPTQEEIDEHWAVFNPEKADPDFFVKFLRLPTDLDPGERKQIVDQFKSLFSMLQTGLVKQSIVGARNLFQEELQKLREEYKPVSEYVSTQRQEQTRKQFYDTYPALALKGEDGKYQFEGIIAATAQTLAGQKFANNDEFFKALAESVAKTIKGVVPTFDLGAKPTKQPAVTTPRLPRGRAGGTGGVGVTGQTDKADGDKKDDSDSIQW